MKDDKRALYLIHYYDGEKKYNPDENEAKDILSHQIDVDNILTGYLESKKSYLIKSKELCDEIIKRTEAFKEDKEGINDFIETYGEIFSKNCKKYLDMIENSPKEIEALFPKFKDMSIKFEIPIKNAYYYQFESTNIIYAFTKYYIDDFGSRIVLSNQPMELIFNLSLYEKCDEMFDFYSDKLIYSELIRVGVTFYVLKFYQAKRDFSFNLTYKIEDLDNDVDIFFENMKNVNVFNFRIFFSFKVRNV